jgi:hypothetical protein
MMVGMFSGATSFDQPLDDWRLCVCCFTCGMFDGTNFENSRPERRACCAVSWREHLRIAWSFAKIISERRPPLPRPHGAAPRRRTRHYL